MSCNHAAASSRSASSPKMGARLRALRATPWVCAHRRGSGCSNSSRAILLAQADISFMLSTLGADHGTLTDAEGPSRDVSGRRIVPPFGGGGRRGVPRNGVYVCRGTGLIEAVTSAWRFDTAIIRAG